MDGAAGEVEDAPKEPPENKQRDEEGKHHRELGCSAKRMERPGENPQCMTEKRY